MKKIVLAVVAAVLAAAASELTRRLIRRSDLALTDGASAEDPEQTVDLQGLRRGHPPGRSAGPRVRGRAGLTAEPA